MTHKQTIELDVNAVQKVLNYLQKCPWGEVNEIMVPLVQAVNKYNQDMQRALPSPESEKTQ